MFVHFILAFTIAEGKDINATVFHTLDTPSSSLTGAYRPVKTETKFIMKKKRPYCSNPFSNYMVSIRKYERDETFGHTHFCAGLIIGPKLILSAAHCYVRDKQVVSASSLRVVAGTPARLVKNHETQVIRVKKIEIHELFAGPENVDAALLKLKYNIKLDNNCAAVVSLPEHPINASSSCLVLGWGRLYFDGPFANLVLQINVTLHSKPYCEPVFMDPNTSKYKICASDRRDYAKNPCLGDSGGPLLCEGVLAGIVSYGFECGFGLPSVYTDVFELRHWIKENSCDSLYFGPKIFWWAIIALFLLVN